MRIGFHLTPFWSPTDRAPTAIIDEAIEVAKRFGGAESGAFVNGVLDAIRRRLDGDRSA